MISLTLLLVMQSKDLNAGQYKDYDGQTALAVWQPLIRGEANWDYASKLGTTSKVVRSMRNKVGARMVRTDLDHVPGVTIEALAKKLKQAVLQTTESSGIKTGSPLEAFLIADGITAWVRSHIVYNTMLVPGKIAAAKGMSLDEERTYRSQFLTSKILLQKRELFAVCAGFSRLNSELARSVGVPLYNVKGFSRTSLQEFGTFHTKPVDHSWNVLVLSDASGKPIIVPFDPSHARVGLSSARKAEFDWYTGSAGPDTPEDAAAFHYWHYGSEVEHFMDKVAEFQPTKLTERQWREMGSVDIIDSYRRRNALKWINSATSDKMPE